MFGGGLLAALVALRRVGAERRNLNASADSQIEATELRRWTDLRTVREELIRSEDRRRELEAAKAALEERLQRGPAALIAEALADLNGLRLLFDMIETPMVVSTSADSGTFVYVNPAFAERLGRTADDIVRLGWRAIIHNDDLPETEHVETSAWTTDVWGYVNRYIHADGSVVWCRWFCRSYRRAGRMTIAVVEMSRRPILDS